MAEVILHRQPRIAKKGSYKVAVKSGESYWWCSCGHSLSQPFCDGSHNKVNEKYGTNFQPIEYKATEDKDVWFCGCKRSAKSPLCDASHSKLSEEEVAAGTFESINAQN